MELLNQTKIAANLDENTRSLINSLEIFGQIDSTNSYLVKQAQKQALTGSVCFAESQTDGRGRLGRQWLSPHGSNIYLSILWRYQAAIMAVSGLGLAVGVAVIRALNAHFPQNHLEIGLKWPNDIYSLDKKLGGILIEASTTADNCCVAVIGLGLNVYLPQSASNSITRPWTDLTTILGQNKVHRNALAAALLNNLLPVIAQFANDGIESYIKEWSGYDCMTGKQATLFYGRQSLTGIIEGVDNKGQLLLRQTNGEVSAYASGEVSFNEVI